MRIAYVNANYQKNHTGGGHVHIEQFISNAINLGHEVWVYPGDQYPGAQIIPTSRLAHIHTMRHMDALYVRLENRSPEICSWSLPPRRILYRFPVITWEFNTLPDELDSSISTQDRKSSTSRILEKYSPGCDLAVCVSPALAMIVNEKLKTKKVITVPNGSDPDKFTPDAPVVQRLSPFKDKFNVIWMGSIKEAWHDLEMLKGAARLISNSGEAKDIQFHILGAGLTGVMGEMPPNVFYWGAEYYDKLPNWLSGMNVGLSLYKPSRATLGSPLKIFDYMASGLTVVSTEHPVAADLFSTLGCTDLVIPHGDSDVLATAITDLANNRDRVRSLGLAGRQLVTEKYTWRRAVQDTMTEIERLLKEKGKVPKA